MNKYSDIEIQTAKNLLKQGYKWIDKKYSGTLYAYKNNPGEAYAPDNTAKIICSSYVPIFESINIEDAPTSLQGIVYPQPEIIRCKDCKHWRQQTNYQGAPLPFGFCESDDMWRSLYGEIYEVSHIDTDGDFYCGYAERRTDE